MTENKLLKTRRGFLHRDITDGYMTEPGGVNYKFTSNPNYALVFPHDGFVPTGLGVPTETELDSANDCADYLNGWFVDSETHMACDWQQPVGLRHYA